MQQSIPRRRLLEAIRVHLAESPVVALLGARQVGKTTLAEEVAAGWEGDTVVFDLESPETRNWICF
jgi:predicted AAA+ superfamily ATPase